MSYTDAQVSSAVAAIDKYRGSETGEVGAALAVVGLCAERATKEAQIRDDMIRVAHRAGASLRQRRRADRRRHRAPPARAARPPGRRRCRRPGR